MSSDHPSCTHCVNTVLPFVEPCSQYASICFKLTLRSSIEYKRDVFYSLFHSILALRPSHFQSSAKEMIGHLINFIFYQHKSSFQWRNSSDSGHWQQCFSAQVERRCRVTAVPSLQYTWCKANVMRIYHYKSKWTLLVLHACGLAWGLFTQKRLHSNWSYIQVSFRKCANIASKYQRHY